MHWPLSESPVGLTPTRFYFNLDHHWDQVISELHKTLGTAILAAWKISQELNLPPLREIYSILGNLGTRMFFQLLQKHRNNWDVPDYRLPKCLQPIEATIDVDIVDFLIKMKSATWEHKLTDTLGPGKSQDIYIGQMYDLMRFLEIALQEVWKESPEFQPIPPLEVPDPDYELARIFHYYFT